MRTETIIKEFYTFEELSEESQATAIDNNRDWNVGDSFWYECVIDDAKEIAKLFGLDIDNIYFSGFSSQGDGACFTGTYGYKKGSLKDVKSYAPLDTDLHEVIADLVTIQKKYFYGLEATVKHSGHYNHSGCTNIEITKRDSEGWQRDLWTFDNSNDSDIQDDLTEALRAFMNWIYKRLENEYYYCTSDDSIKESLIANETEFDKEGNIA